MTYRARGRSILEVIAVRSSQKGRANRPDYNEPRSHDVVFVGCLFCRLSSGIHYCTLRGQLFSRQARSGTTTAEAFGETSRGQWGSQCCCDRLL
jgi:hypothetical protein